MLAGIVSGSLLNHHRESTLLIEVGEATAAWPRAGSGSLADGQHSVVSSGI